MTNDTIEPRTVDTDGKAPAQRFTRVESLHSAYREAVREQDRNQARFADIRSIYDGMAPEIDKFPGMPSINQKQFQAKTDAYVQTWVHLNASGAKLADVQAQAHGEESATEIQEYSEQLTQFFNDAIQEWDSADEDDEDVERSLFQWLTESTVRDTQMGLFGIGFAYACDDTDWRYITIPTRNVKIPQGTKITLRNGQAVFIERTYTVTELYGLREREGWDSKQILDLLYRKVVPQNMVDGGRESLAEWENRVRNNDDFLTYNFAQLNLVDAYVQEFDGNRVKKGISHYVFPQNEAGENFLFKRDRQYKRFSQFMVPFVDNPGPEGDWHGVRAFGDLIFDACHFNNLFFNYTSRMALVANAPMFTGSGEVDRQKMSQLTWSPLGIMSELEPKQIKVNVDLNGCLAVMKQSTDVMDQNSRIFPQNDKTPQGGPVTATQAAFDRQDQATFTGTQVDIYRTGGADRLFTQMYRRLTRPASDYPESLPGGKTAARFRAKCKKAGIPEKCYRNPLFVRANRSGGSGNQGLDLMKAKEALAVASPGAGQENAREEVIASMYGHTRVPEFIEKEPVIGEQDRVIAMENSILNLGQVVLALPPDDHEKHLGVPDPNGSGHLAIMAVSRMAAMQLQESNFEPIEDATRLSRTMEAVFQHCQSHAEFLATMPKYEESAVAIEKLLEQFKQFIITFNDGVSKALKERQPQGPQMSADDQAKLIKAQVESQILAAKADLEMRLRQQAQDMKLGHLAERAAFKQEVDVQKHQTQQAAALQTHETQLGLDAEQRLIDQEARRNEELAKLAETRAKANVQNVKQ